MYKSYRIATVIPAYNEAERIARVLGSIPDLVDHIIVVDDGSVDGTREAAVACGDCRLIVLTTPQNQGVGGATMVGYQKALEIDAAIIVKMDGDGQMIPAYLTALLDPLVDRAYDYAKGNRFLAGEALSTMPRHRLFGNVILTFMTKVASGYWHVFDPQNGYTAIRAEALRTLDLDAVHKRFFFENDMLVHLGIFGRRVIDVAIPARYGDERSKLNPLRIAATFPALLLLRFFYRVYQKYVLRDFSPIALFLILGLLLFGWGAAFGLYLWIKSIGSTDLTPTGTIMLSLLPLIIGFQLLLQAIVLDIQETPK
jgi:glycosyltransferase involved in cell wall biosynthesis